MMSQHIDKTPPSPSPTTFMPPPSPYTMFDVPFEQLTISSSPEPSKQKANSSQRNSLNVPTISTNSNNNATNNSNTQTDSLTPPSPPPPPPHAAPRERPCKRTLSRTRSQRKGPPKTSTNKRNKRVSQQQPLSDDEQQQQQPAQQQQQPAQQQQQQPVTAPEEPQLDHGKVMEALRAKLQRSAALQPHQQQQQQKQEQDQTPNSMSPTGILLLDLKNPNRKSFPTRKPHVAAVRRPRPFASAHNYCESSVKKEQG